jgi:hypothetical protein
MPLVRASMAALGNVPSRYASGTSSRARAMTEQ